MISLDTLDIATPSDEGVEIELLHPTTLDPLGIFIKIAGRHSERYSKIQRKRANEKAKEARQAQLKGKPPEAITLEEIERQGVSVLAECTLGWRTGDAPTVNFDGKDYPFSTDAAEVLYSSPKWTWIKTQVDQAIHNDGNFLKL